MVPVAAAAGLWAVAWIVDALLRGAGGTVSSLYLVAKAPGTVIHEASYAIACVLFGVHVHRVTFFQRVDGEPAGFVERIGTPHAFGSLAIAGAPVLAGATCTAGFVELALYLDASGGSPLLAGTAWFLAACTALSSRPSGTDTGVAARDMVARGKETVATCAGLAAGVVLAVVLPLPLTSWWHVPVVLVVVLLPGWACCKVAARAWSGVGDA